LRTTQTYSTGAATILALEMDSPMEIGDNDEAEGGGGRTEGREVTTDGTVSGAEDNDNDETAAPSALARTLGTYRPALRRIRRKLHGCGDAQGITDRLTALLLWVSMQLTRTTTADPVVFLANLGEGEGEGRNKGGRKSKRPSLTNFQTPRFRQEQLNFGERGREGETEGGGRAERGSAGDRRDRE
jgi:hypothetical protein